MNDFRFQGTRVSGRIRIGSHGCGCAITIQADDDMLRFFKRIFFTLRVRRLKAAAERDPTPRTAVQLCELLEGLRKFAQAVAEARLALARFPHARDLEDV